jgi:hypothetical protein
MKLNKQNEPKEPKKVKVYKIKTTNIQKMIEYLKKQNNDT